MRQKREEIVLNYSINLNELSKEQIECLETVGISTKDNMHYIEGRPLTYIPSADYMRVLIYDGNSFLFERYDTNSGSGIAIPSSLANPKAKISINEGKLSYGNNTIRRNILVDLDFNSFGNKVKFDLDIYNKPIKVDYHEGWKIGSFRIGFTYDDKEYGPQDIFESYTITSKGINNIKYDLEDYAEELIAETENFNTYYLMNSLQAFFKYWENIILEGVKEEEKEKSLKTIETYLEFLRVYAETFFNTYKNGYTELVNRQIEEDNRKRKIRI